MRVLTDDEFQVLTDNNSGEYDFSNWEEYEHYYLNEKYTECNIPKGKTLVLLCLVYDENGMSTTERTQMVSNDTLLVDTDDDMLVVAAIKHDDDEKYITIDDTGR